MEFTPAGTRDKVPLFAHECRLFGVTYVSEAPSQPGDPDVVPMCGCHLEEEHAVPWWAPGAARSARLLEERRPS